MLDLTVMFGRRVTISAESIHPGAVESLKKEHGDIFGMRGTVVGESPVFNSSFLVKLEDGRTLDLHDQWYWRSLQRETVRE